MDADGRRWTQMDADGCRWMQDGNKTIRILESFNHLGLLYDETISSRRGGRDVNEELQAAADHLNTYGYCVLKDRIPREVALALGRRCLALHSDPALRGLYRGRTSTIRLCSVCSTKTTRFGDAPSTRIPWPLRGIFWGRAAASSKRAPSRLGQGHPLSIYTSILRARLPKCPMCRG